MYDDIVITTYPDEPGMVFLSAVTEDGIEVKAAARITVKKKRIRVEPSVWETEDGEHVDAPRLTAEAKKLVKQFVVNERNT